MTELQNDTTSKNERFFRDYRFRGKSEPLVGKKKISQRANYLNKRFGRAVVKELLGNEEHGYKWWGLECDCGTKFSARSRELLRGHTKSCGCLQREAASRNGTSSRLPYGEAAKNELYASYIKSAKSRGVNWEISLKEFETIVVGTCVYCGTPPNKYRKPHAGVYGGFDYNGVDRVDNNLGYTIRNSASCCWVCNRAKGSLTKAQFYEWIDRIAQFRSRGESP